MKIEYLIRKGTWLDVRNATFDTISKEHTDEEPSKKTKRMLLRNEHSPIRKLIYEWKWIGLQNWVSTHFVRHKYGIEHFVSSRREDITGVPRESSNLVNHSAEANVQALINISRKRLCQKSHTETRIAWIAVISNIKDEDIRQALVPECIYRGHCYEFKSCGYHKTDEYKQQLEVYREGIN